MRLIRSSKFVRGAVRSSSELPASGIRKITRQIELVSRFEIVEIKQANKLVITSNSSEVIFNGLILLKDSGEQDNDGFYELIGHQTLQADRFELTIRSNKLNLSNEPNGVVLQHKPITINHNLNTSDLSISLREIASGNAFDINSTALDNNTLILKPDIPIDGDFRLTIIA